MKSDNTQACCCQRSCVRKKRHTAEYKMSKKRDLFVHFAVQEKKSKNLLTKNILLKGCNISVVNTVYTQGARSAAVPIHSEAVEHLYKAGEVIKQPFTDILLTDLEQISFSIVGITLDRNIKIGVYLNAGDKIGKKDGTSSIIGFSGQVIQMDKKQITLQKTQPVLFYSEADIHVKTDEWVKKGNPIITLTHQTLITGDIVQGIPKIEQLFEAPGAKEGEPLSETLHLQLREIFRQYWTELPLPQAVRQSLEEIQQTLVESIQRVYLSQGVLIADKHIEIVVRQMTAKAQILESGNTGLFLEEILPIRQIEAANLTTPGKKALYMPAVIGLTRASLDSESFISAASFQETTRVLSRDAVIGKSDFLRGLKEKVVIGDLISAGTGLDNYFIYNILCEQGYISINKSNNPRGFIKHDSQKMTNQEPASRNKNTRKKSKKVKQVDSRKQIN